MLFYREYVVRKHERGLLFKKGDFVRFLAPGTYRLFGTRKRYRVERFDLSEPRFEHRLTDFFTKHYAADVERLFDVIETAAQEVAVVYHNGRFTDVIGPQQRVLYWKGTVDIGGCIAKFSSRCAPPSVPARLTLCWRIKVRWTVWFLKPCMTSSPTLASMCATSA